MTFTLGENLEELKAHKFFLMTASPVFHSIFSSTSDADGIPLDVKIVDISKATMIEICRFAYSEILNINKANMIEILNASTKLQMKFLTEKTIDFMCKGGLDEHTIFKILESNKDNNMRLNMKCFEFIQKNHKKCFKAVGFSTLPIDSLRTLLQTCKVPKLAAKEAIAFWSSHPGNIDEDLDELMELVSLKDDVDESENHLSDTESVGSRQSSVAGSSASGKKQPRIQKFQQGQNRPNQTNANRPHQNFANPQNFPNQQRPQHQRGGPNRQHPPQQMINRVAPQLSPTMKNFTIQGRVTRKNVKFANLNLATLAQSIFINEIHFMYDMSTTDREFDFRIIDLTKQKKDLFYSRISTSQKVNNEFTHYILPRPCQINGGSKIWISIEFLRSEHRLSFEAYTATNTERMTLRRDEGSSAQIISNIVYTDCPSNLIF